MHILGVQDEVRTGLLPEDKVMETFGQRYGLEKADVALMADDFFRLPFLCRGFGPRLQVHHALELVCVAGRGALLIHAILFGWAGIGVAVLFYERSTLVVTQR